MTQAYAVQNRFDIPLTRFASVLLYLLPTLVFFGKIYPDIAASTLAVLFLIRSVIIRDFAWLKSSWVRIALGFWLFLVFRSLFSTHIMLALSVALPFGRFVLFAAAIAFWLGLQPLFARRMVIALGIGATLLAADCWLQFFTGSDILGKPKWASERLTGPFRRPRVGYTMTWMLFPLLAVLLAPRHSALQYVAALGLAAFLVMAVLITGERTPLLLLLMGIGLICILHKRLRKLALLGLPLAIAAIGLLLWMKPVLYERQVLSTRDTIAHLWDTPYGHIWLDARDTILQEPLAGIGPHHYRTACSDPTLHYRECQLHPHNFYLELATETGIIGLCALLILFGSWLYSLWKARAIIPGDIILIGLTADICMRLWPVIANPSFYESWNVIPLWLLVGWMYSILGRHEHANLHSPA